MDGSPERVASAEITVQPQRPRLVIIGAGFGGLAAATRLKGADAEITVIDQHNHHLFQPLLYQVATAALSPADIPRRSARSSVSSGIRTSCWGRSPVSTRKATRYWWVSETSLTTT
jgi:hypothetical protein